MTEERINKIIKDIKNIVITLLFCLIFLFGILIAYSMEININLLMISFSIIGSLLFAFSYISDRLEDE